MERTETQTPRLPDRPWELSAPESYVLRQTVLALPEITARFAIFELVAREALRLGPARVRRRRGRRRLTPPAVRRRSRRPWS